MRVRTVAVALLVFVIVSATPMSGVAVEDAWANQDEPDDEGITVSEMEVKNLTLVNVTIQNLSVESLEVTDEEMTDVPSSIDNETVTVSATMQDVTFENVTIRNDSLAKELVGAETGTLENRTENRTEADNETKETGLAQQNASLTNTTIEGVVLESALIRNVTGNASTEGQIGDGNETEVQQNDTESLPVIEAANMTIGHLDFTSVPTENQEESEGVAEEMDENGTENETEAAEGGVSDNIIGDENLTTDNRTNETDENRTNATAGNGTDIGGEVGQDFTAENESNVTNITVARYRADSLTLENVTVKNLLVDRTAGLNEAIDGRNITKNPIRATNVTLSATLEDVNVSYLVVKDEAVAKALFGNVTDGQEQIRRVRVGDRDVANATVNGAVIERLEVGNVSAATDANQSAVEQLFATNDTDTDEFITAERAAVSADVVRIGNVTEFNVTDVELPRTTNQTASEP